MSARLNRGGDAGVDAVIAASGTKTNGIDFRASAFGGVILPATFTGTALTFEVSHDDVTYQGLYDEFGTAVSMTVAQGRSYPLPGELAGFPYFKIVSGSSEAAARTLRIVRKQ